MSFNQVSNEVFDESKRFDTIVLCTLELLRPVLALLINKQNGLKHLSRKHKNDILKPYVLQTAGS